MFCSSEMEFHGLSLLELRGDELRVAPHVVHPVDAHVGQHHEGIALQTHLRLVVGLQGLRTCFATLTVEKAAEND